MHTVLTFKWISILFYYSTVVQQTLLQIHLKVQILNKKRITPLNFCFTRTCKLPGRSYPPSGLSTAAVETRCGLTHCRSPPANQQPPYSMQNIAGPRCPMTIRLSKSNLQLYPVQSAALFRAYPSACIKDRYTKQSASFCAAALQCQCRVIEVIIIIFLDMF